MIFKNEYIEAIEAGQFIPYMELIYDIRKGRYIGAELLARWQKPDIGIMMPASFIDEMNDSGAIIELDFYMFRKTCELLQNWCEAPMKSLDLSCNFSRKTFSQPDFIERFTEILNSYTFERNRILIEITEDSLMKDLSSVYDNMIKCHELGVKLALDDLGAGYSSFNDLCDMPVDYIKIDKHITEKSITERGETLVGGLVIMCHRLGIKVISEGVETENEKKVSVSSDCDFIQGYYYTKPLPLEEGIEKYIHSIK